MKTQNIWRYLITFAFVILLCWLYYPVMFGFFKSDDWLWLWHISKVPVEKPWLYFSPKAIWFYRPLQTFAYGVTYHLAGLDYRAYALQLLAMHLVVCWLVWKQVMLLFGRTIAAVTVLLFGVSSLTPDMLLWVANHNTFQYALMALGTGCCFTIYLQSRKKRWLAWALALAVASWFSKESCINIPLLLSVIWITLFAQWKWNIDQTAFSLFSDRGFRNIGTRFIRDLVPFYGLTLVYVALHTIYFENVEATYQLQYTWTRPGKALLQWMDMINFSLFAMPVYPYGISIYPAAGVKLMTALKYAWFVPPILLAVALKFKKPAILFSVLSAACYAMPIFLMERYEANRYHYPSAFAGMLLMGAVCKYALGGELTRESLKRLGAPEANRRRYAAYAALVLLVSIIVTNVVAFQSILSYHNLQAAYVKRAFDILHIERENFPEKSIIRYELHPNSWFSNGIGAAEMAWLATGRKDIQATANAEALGAQIVRQMEAIPHKYVFNIFSDTPEIVATDDIWPYGILEEDGQTTTSAH